MSTEVHTLSGAYVLHAVTPQEAADFHAHLLTCESCRAEVSELEAVAAMMGLADARAVPPGLRAAVLSAADRTPQEPPERRPQPTRSSSSADTEGARRALPRRSWRPVLAGLAAGLVLLAGGALGFQALQDDEPTMVAAAARVFEADDARSVVLASNEGGEVVVAVSARRQEMALDTSRLPGLPSGYVYQLWSIQAGRPTSQAVLNDPAAGAAVALPAADTRVALTVEPVGGSPQPTTTPIVSFAAASI